MSIVFKVKTKISGTITPGNIVIKSWFDSAATSLNDYVKF